MSGIMEQVLAEVQALRAEVRQLGALTSAPGQFAQQPAQQLAAQPFAGQVVGQQPVQQAQFGQQLGQQPVQQQGLLGQQYAQPPVQQTTQFGGTMGQVTAESITALVTPILEMPNGREALRAEMTAAGVADLPTAPPEKYGELYQRFQAVQQRLMGGGQVQQQPNPGII